MANISFTIGTIPFIILLLIICTYKKVWIRGENKIYYLLIIASLIGTMIDAATYLILIFDKVPITSTAYVFLTKTLFCYYDTWCVLFLIYIFSILHKDSKTSTSNEVLRKITIVLSIALIVLYIINYTTSIEYIIKNNQVYPQGNSVIITYIFTTISIIIMAYSVLKNKKMIKRKEIIPLWILIFLGTLIVILQLLIPSLMLITAAEAFITFLMYFTIENPDVKMLEQVSLAKEAAEKANNAKSDFLSNMSHEIRTPLNAIVGFSESLKEDNIPEESKYKVEDIIIASNNLLEIVNGILDISKIEANKLEIINKEYDVHSMFDELVALTKARIGDKDLEFRVNIDQSLPSILYGDNLRLKQIILNILTNAVKYTKEGFIDFTVSTVIKNNVCRLIVSVEDSGIGMKEESLNKLFTKFERLNVEKEITIEGTGLGLAITKKLVELMNGKIIVQSVYGKGSKFTVSIDQRIIAVEKPLTKLEAKSESKIVDANGAKLLIVDDNELNIKVASILLKKYNFNIESCTSAISCIAKINNGEKFDIILMDDMMPKMTGKQAVKKLKENPNFKTPVVVLTANAITGMKEEYLASGFDDYLSKPIEKKELERVIKEHIHNTNTKEINTSSSNSINSILEKEIDLDKTILLKPIKELNIESKKILIVDDNELNIKVAETTLKKYNLDITSVMSGSECIEKVIEDTYDLILLDDMMPELDGCKTLENLKTLDGFNTPVVMMTASSKDEVEDKIKEFGFSGYLSKPFKREDLEEIFETLLNK